MDNRLILGFCSPCQGLFAPWRLGCPACRRTLFPVWITDAAPRLIAEIRTGTADGSQLAFHLEDEAAHLVLIADLLVQFRAAA